MIDQKVINTIHVLATETVEKASSGHPEYGHTAGIEITTGPLGQGITSTVGIAMAEAHLSSHFNKENFPIVDHYTYVLVGDGSLMEDISYEAASLAGTLALGKLIVLYDSNNITIDGNTSITFTENVRAILESAKSIHNGKPIFIEVKTLIGYGCPTKQGRSSAHGDPLVPIILLL